MPTNGQNTAARNSEGPGESDETKAARNAADVSGWVTASNEWHGNASEAQRRQGFPSFAQWMEQQGKRTI
jgi:hypothetical protein